MSKQQILSSLPPLPIKPSCLPTLSNHGSASSFNLSISTEFLKMTYHAKSIFSLAISLLRKLVWCLWLGNLVFFGSDGDCCWFWLVLTSLVFVLLCFHLHSLTKYAAILLPSFVCGSQKVYKTSNYTSIPADKQDVASYHQRMSATRWTLVLMYDLNRWMLALNVCFHLVIVFLGFEEDVSSHSTTSFSYSLIQQFAASIPQCASLDLGFIMCLLWWSRRPSFGC